MPRLGELKRKSRPQRAAPWEPLWHNPSRWQISAAKVELAHARCVAGKKTTLRGAVEKKKLRDATEDAAVRGAQRLLMR